jgi:hypothetical protein
MASGVGFGSDQRDPNDSGDGYLDGNYVEWYEAPSKAEKIAALKRRKHLQDMMVSKSGWCNGAICQNLDPDHRGIATFGAELWGVDWTQGELL